MERKVLNYASTSKTAVNIIEADGFRIKGGEIIGMTPDIGNKEVKIISYASTTKSSVNIVEADGFQIKGLGMIGEVVSSPSIEKHSYVAKQKLKDDMSDTQKAGITLWNSLIQKLEDAGLMESKK